MIKIPFSDFNGTFMLHGACRDQFAISSGHQELKAVCDYVVESVSEALEMIMKLNEEETER